MVRVKQSVKQNDFSLGEVRSEFLEDDGGEVRARSLREAMNVFPNGVKGLIRAPGRKVKGGFLDIINPCGEFEIEPAEGVFFLVVLSHEKLSVFDTSGALVQSYPAPWQTNEQSVENPPVWSVTARDIIYFGGAEFPLHVLSYDAGVWTFSGMAFEEAPGGEIAQPYFAFERGVTIAPSALTGAVTITASEEVFTSQFVGQRIRYHGKEIEITSFTSTTSVGGNVITNLPPSFDVVVEDASGFSEKEIVKGVDSAYTGYVTSIDYATNTIKMATLRGHEGPFEGDLAEEISGADTSSKVVSKTKKTAPYASPNWEEPVLSPHRGYAASAAGIGGRIVLGDFDSHPGLVVVSSSRSLRDFRAGTGDDDGFIRTLGERGTSVRHVVDAGDLVLLANDGAYVVEAKGGTPITPSTFNPILFDTRGSNRVRPIVVGSSVVYVSASGNDLLTAAQSGNIYLKWGVTDLSKDSNHLIDNPVQICPPPSRVSRDERFVLIVNSDGSSVAVTYNDDMEQAGFFPLSHTAIGGLGDLANPWRGMGVKLACPFNGKIWAIVEHEFDTPSYQLECLDFDAVMHSVIEAIGGSNPDLSRFAGAPFSVWGGGYYHGSFETDLAASEYIAQMDPAVTYQIGIGFVVRAAFWPVELINSPRFGMINARTIRVAISVKDTTSYFVRRNSTNRDVGFYQLGDDLSEPPAPRTEVRRFPVLGNRDHPDIAVGQNVPGAFELLAYTVEVQG